MNICFILSLSLSLSLAFEEQTGNKATSDCRTSIGWDKSLFGISSVVLQKNHCVFDCCHGYRSVVVKGEVWPE